MERRKSPAPSKLKERPGEFGANLLWLDTNWLNYKDRWVALNNGSLLASAAKHEDLQPHLVNFCEVNILCLLVGRDYIGENRG